MERPSSGERLYRALLRLYPVAFRHAYGDDLFDAFATRYQRQSTNPLRFWTFHLRDFARSLVREHWDARNKRLNRSSNQDERPTHLMKERIMGTLLQDLRYAARSFKRNPVFTAVVVLTLGLGIGLNTAIFSVVRGVLLRPLPYAESDQLMWMWGTFSGGNSASISPPDFLDYRDQNEAFEHLGARRGIGSYALTGFDRPELILGQQISADLLEAFGVAPVLGRSFTREDERGGNNDVVVLSYGFWQRMFGGDRDALTRTLTLEGRVHRIVGVMPAGFSTLGETDIWAPIAFDAPGNQVRRFHNVRMIGRLKPGVTPEAALADMNLIAEGLEEAYPESNTTWRVAMMPLVQNVVGNVRSGLWIMLGAVAFVLAIACVNVANLLLARGAARQSEMAVRASLGAGRNRIIQQLLTESVLLAMLGGILGLGLAVLGVDLLRTMQPGNLPRMDEVAVDGLVLGFALVASLGTGLAFGLFPALASSKPDLQATLKEGGRTGVGGGSRTRAALVMAEVALSLILLVGAGLLIQSFWRLNSVDPGFEPKNKLAARISLPRARYAEPELRTAFFDQLRERLESTPGVANVALASIAPLARSWNDTYLAVPGRHQLGTDTQFNAQQRFVSANYFDVMQISVLRGRAFSDSDRRGTSNVVIIDEPLATQIFPDEDPIGQRLQIDFGQVHDAEIIGVVGGVNHGGLGAARPMHFYIPVKQLSVLSLTVVIDAAVDPTTLAVAVPEAVWEVDPLQPVMSVTQYEDIVAGSVAQPRFQMLLLGLFAAVALGLAGVGIYGVLGYYVTQRAREVGVRVALGAKRRDVYRLVVGRGMTLVGMGLGIGAIGAMGLSRFMSSLLFEVSATDPVTYLAVGAVLTVIALAASFLPARRAAAVDPIEALRAE